MEILLLIKALMAALPVLIGILNLFYRTPAEKWNQLSGRLVHLFDDVKVAVEEGKKDGNYQRLEDLLNSDSK